MLLINSFPKTRINDIIAPAGNVQTKRSYSYPSSRFSPLILLRSADLRSLPPDQLTPWGCVMHRAALANKRSPVLAEDSGNTQPSVLRKFPRNYQTGGVLSLHPGAPDMVSAHPPPPLVMSPHSPPLNKCSQYSNCTPMKSLISK